MYHNFQVLGIKTANCNNFDCKNKYKINNNNIFLNCKITVPLMVF